MTAPLRASEFTVATAEATVEAGQPLTITVRFVADRPTEIAADRSSFAVGGGRPLRARMDGRRRHGELPPLRRPRSCQPRPPGPLVAGQQLVRRVTVAVPAGEASVDGYLVQQEYAVRARLQLRHGRDAEASTAVLVTSRAADRSWVADTAAVVNDEDVAGLGIEEVSSRQLFAGVPISGTVTVTPAGPVPPAASASSWSSRSRSRPASSRCHRRKSRRSRQ